uniref:Uncharacterized protein n=1 Tax=Sphaerodactylus townsendi TaxID=933632 RepID=A0ACB8E6M4_9SAUR
MDPVSEEILHLLLTLLTNLVSLVEAAISCSTSMLDLMSQEYEESDPSPVATAHHDSQEWMALASAPQTCNCSKDYYINS